MQRPDTVVRWHRAGFRLFWALEIKVSSGPARGAVPGMPGPHRGDRRAASAPYPQMLHRVLQRGAHASIVEQRCAHLEGHPQAALRCARRTGHHQYVRI